MKTMLRHERSRLVSVLFVALAAVHGCRSGDDAGSSGTGPGPTAPGGIGCGTVAAAPAVNPTPVYLAGQAGVSTTIGPFRADLVAFDPAAVPPSAISPALAAAGTYSNEVAIEYGVYDTNTKTVREPYIRNIVFVQGGQFFKVDLRRNGGNLTPTQVSNESGASQLCTFNQKQLVDYIDPDNTSVLYSLPGADNLCGTADDIWRAIKLGMGSTTAPITARPSITGLLNSSGAAVGWLAINGNQVVRYDTNFNTQAATSLTAITAGSVEEISRGRGGVEKAVINVNNSLRIYDCSTATSPTALNLSLAGSTIPATAADATAIYAGVSNGVSVTIYRIALDGSTPTPPLLVTEGFPLTPNSMVASANRVLYMLTTSGNAQRLKSVPKTGDSSITLPVLGSSDFTGLSGGVVAANNKVYYNVVEVPQGILHAGVQNDDGSTIPANEPGDTRWLGLTFPGDPPNLSSISNFSRLIRAEGLSSAPTVSYAGATLKVFEPTTGAELCTLSPTLPPVVFDGLEFDRNKDFSLGQAFKSSISTTGAFTADLYSASIGGAACRLTRVTANIQ